MTDNLADWEAKGFTMKNGKLVKSNSPSNKPVKKSHNKYRNRRVTIDGINFDSEKEGRYYSKLMLLKKAGEVKEFSMQVKFPIEVNGIHIANYRLDFRVEYSDGRVEYIDIKGRDKKTHKWITTDVFKLKKKLVEAIYEIEIKFI